MSPEVGFEVVHRSCPRWCRFQSIIEESADVPVESVILVISTRCYLIHGKGGWKREMTMVVLKRQG